MCHGVCVCVFMRVCVSACTVRQLLDSVACQPSCCQTHQRLAEWRCRPRLVAATDTMSVGKNSLTTSPPPPFPYFVLTGRLGREPLNGMHSRTSLSTALECIYGRFYLYHSSLGSTTLSIAIINLLIPRDLLVSNLLWKNTTSPPLPPLTSKDLDAHIQL